jgi:hypothetical protein
MDFAIASAHNPPNTVISDGPKENFTERTDERREDKYGEEI